MDKEPNDAIELALDWLIRQQSQDGGWHSRTYGQLKDGAAVTALILYAVAHARGLVGLSKRHREPLQKANDFLEPGRERTGGAIASPDGTFDFPTYAAAQWLTYRRRISLPDRDLNQDSVLNDLVNAQVTKDRGFGLESPSYGGWDFLRRGDAVGVTTGTNVSVTRFALEALSEEFALKAKLDDRTRDADFLNGTTKRAIEAGQSYVLRCQQADGGFAFTCEPGSLNNKAAYSDAELTRPRSYGTATCDGVLALLACGQKATDGPVSKAIAWLAKRPGLELVPGFEGLPAEDGWDRGLRFYYYSALARVLPYFPLSDRESRQQALARHIIALQKNDGHWVSESDRMRENDPLIATGLAIVALSAPSA